VKLDLPLLPTIHALALAGVGGVRPPLTEQQRRKLAAAATRLELPAKAIIYRDGDPAGFVFISGGGVVISYKDMPSGKRRVAGFRYHGDLFGLADAGTYVNSARAVTAVTIYRIPLDALATIIRQDAELEFHFVCKMVDELRQAQRKAIIVARRDASGRVAMFVDMLRRVGPDVGDNDLIELPMSRSDIADFLNLTLESVSRACSQLKSTQVLAFGRNSARILDRARFDALVGGS
jgi:CRP/FNR family transcriptional regulator